MKILLIIFSLLTLLCFNSCNSPEDRFVGKWEFDSFEIDESGAGVLLSFLPKNWKEEVDLWLAEYKGITNSELEFFPDGRFKESFSGIAEKFTNIEGNFTVTPDLSEIRLLIKDKEQVMHIENFNDSSFVYLKEFAQYEVPLTLRITYVKKI